MSNMHPDLEWLARNVSEWTDKDPKYYRAVCRFGDSPKFVIGENGHTWCGIDLFGEPQWRAARKELGLIMTEEEGQVPAEGHARTAPDFLHQAASLMQERGKQYDQPGGERSMGKTIAAFNAITGRNLSEPEGWMLMGLLKTVRQYSGDYHQDSAEDKIAYAALEAESLESSALRARELECKNSQ